MIPFAHLPELPGVYLLTHRTTGDTYVGSAANIRKRVKQHGADLRNGSCACGRLFKCAHQHGCHFDSRVLEIALPELRLVSEQRWIDQLSPTLNGIRRISLNTRR